MEILFYDLLDILCEKINKIQKKEKLPNCNKKIHMAEHVLVQSIAPPVKGSQVEEDAKHLNLSHADHFLSLCTLALSPKTTILSS